MSNDIEKKNQADLVTKNDTVSARFVEKVQEQFNSAVSANLAFSDHEKALATNLYVYLDNTLKALEAKRNNSNPEFAWKNVNMNKLAVDAVHRIRLGLDALIPNHLHAVPYLNGTTKQYDLDLRVGFVGKLFIAQQVSLYPIKDIRIEVVYSNDEFKAIMKNGLESSETYEFGIPKPFDRGEVIGGFGYVMYEDESKNKLVLVDEDYFKKIKGTAASQKFWGTWGDEMRYKTLAHRVSEKIQVDPKKVHDSYHKVQQEEDPFAEPPKREKVSLDTSVPAPELGAKDVQYEEEEEQLEASVSGQDGATSLGNTPEPNGQQFEIDMSDVNENSRFGN